MLIIDIKLNGGLEVNPDTWYDIMYDYNNLLNDFDRRLLKTIAKCDVINTDTLQSEILGIVNPNIIGSGCKAVLYMKYGYSLGDPRINMNQLSLSLIPFIHEIAREKDIELFGETYLRYFMHGQYNDPIKIKNTGKIYKSESEYVSAFTSVFGDLISKLDLRW